MAIRLFFKSLGLHLLARILLPVGLLAAHCLPCLADDGIVRFTDIEPIEAKFAKGSIGLHYEPTLVRTTDSTVTASGAFLTIEQNRATISWEDMRIQAVLVKGLKLWVKGAHPDKILITWITDQGARIELTPKPLDRGVEDGFRIYEVDLTLEQKWRDVIESLKIEFKKASDPFEIGRLQLLPADLAGHSSRFRVDTALGNCMAQMAPSEHTFRLTLPPFSCISFGARVLSTEFHGLAEATFSIEVKPPGEIEWDEIFNKRIPSTDRISFFKAPVPESNGELIDIRFRVLDPDGHAVGIWHSPVAYSRKEHSERGDFILYIVDTLRSDHLGVYGYNRMTSPRIDALAGEGVTFKNAYSQTSWTRPSYTSIMTSLYLDTHGVKHSMEVYERLSDSITTLAEAVRGEGIFTVGFLVNGFAHSDFGLDQGFDLAIEYPNKFPSKPHYMTVGEVTDTVIEWLEQNKDLNYFMTIFVVDPHEPFVPPESYCKYFGCERSIDKYDAEIRFVDDQVGRLIDTLKRSDAYDSTTILFTSDHGEEFNEHGGYYHGNTLYEEVMRIPLILKGPNIDRGRTVEQLVETVDIGPTFLELMAVESHPRWQGRSLAPLASGEPDRWNEKPPFMNLNRHVLESADKEGGKQEDDKIIRAIYAVRKGDFKLIETRDDDPLFPSWELYDLARDPGEQKSSIIAHPIRFYRLWSELRRLKEEAQFEAVGSETMAETVSQEEIERLKAIGYLQ